MTDDTQMTIEQAFFKLAMRLGEARSKHPNWVGQDKDWAMSVIKAEFDELHYAVGYESRERQVDEALDVAATCMRFVLGDHIDGAAL